MAINVNTVYQTVLSILNKEQRGYLTPAEFNKVGGQVQLEIFEKYAEDMNQQLRVPQVDLDYSDRQINIDEKISIFKTNETLALASSKVTPTSAVQELGSVIYSDREAQRIQQHDIYTTNQSPLTAPTAYYPVYTYEGGEITLFPTLTGSVILNYLKY